MSLLPSVLQDIPGEDCIDDGPQVRRGQFHTQIPLRYAESTKVCLTYQWVGPGHGYPFVFVAGGISAHKHLAGCKGFPEDGWCQELVGNAKALDPSKFNLLSFDFLGADGLLDVPLDTQDQAQAILRVLNHLGVGHLHAFVGYSYGALVGQQLAILAPERVEKLVCVSGSHRPHPFASAWRACQRAALALGQVQGCEDIGLSLARQMAMLSYRTPEEFAKRFDASPRLATGYVRVESEDYLAHAGARYVARTPAVAFLRLSESIDLHRVDPAQITTCTLVVAVDSDRLVPLEDATHFLEGLAGKGVLRVIRSHYGHDAFLKEHSRIDGLLGAFIVDKDLQAN
jgi:homoserine O-acetyltransferase